MYCKLFSEEYEKLIDLYKTKRNEDLILARLEGGANPMILSRYGIYRFTLLALFKLESKRIYAVYQGMRTAEQLDLWFDFIAPRIQIKNNNNINNNNTNNIIILIILIILILIIVILIIIRIKMIKMKILKKMML